MLSNRIYIVQLPKMRLQITYSERCTAPTFRPRCAAVQRDEKLVSLIAEAHQAKLLVLANPDKSLATIAATPGRCRTRLGKLAALTCLAPDIVTAFVEGRQHATLKASTLLDIEISLVWRDRHALLGFR